MIESISHAVTVFFYLSPFNFNASPRKIERWRANKQNRTADLPVLRVSRILAVVSLGWRQTLSPTGFARGLPSTVEAPLPLVSREPEIPNEVHRSVIVTPLHNLQRRQ